MKQYHDLLRNVMTTGVDRSDRTGTGTRSVFGYQMRFNLQEGFPLLTTKKLHLRSIVGELLWFAQGRTDVQWLQERRVTIWDEWVKEDGTIGPGYGHQWRHWDTPDGGHVDQLSNVVNSIKTDPFSRRHIVNAWNAGVLDEMALPPCHTMFQFYVTPDEDGNPHSLSAHLYQRSGDVFLGVPYNIASYALLTHMVAKECGLLVGDFVHTLGDAHIYHNHFDQVKEQMQRPFRRLPTLHIEDRETAAGEPLPLYEIEDFTVTGYDPHPSIKAPVAV